MIFLTEAVNVAVFLLVLLLPGALIYSSLQSSQIPFVKFLLYAFCISLAYNIVVVLALLYLGLFSMHSYFSVFLFIALFVIAIQHKTIKGSILKINIDMKESLGALLVFLVMAIIFFATPHWNFLYSPNMDAGNYETYSNHFWKTGSLYFDSSDYINRSIPKEWILSRNTWYFSDNESPLLQLAYLQGFPAYLSLAKAIFSRPTISSYAVIAVALGSTLAIFHLVFRQFPRPLLATLVTLTICITPLFFYYGKQIMSEQLSLFGVLILAISILEADEQNEKSTFLIAFFSCVLVFLSKLDSYIILTAIGMATLLVLVQSPFYIAKQTPILVSIGLAALFTGLINSFLAYTGYLSHFSVAAIENIVNIPFLVIYTTGFLAFTLVLWFVLRRNLILTGLDKLLFPYRHIISVLVTASFIGYIAWNLSLRPISAYVETISPANSENHNVLNLVKLFWLSSPVVLAVGLVSVIFSFVLSRPAVKFTILILSFNFFYTLYDSHHSPSDIWWMRRYLHSLLPLLAISIGFMFSLFIKPIQEKTNKNYLTASLLVLLTLNLIFIRPLLYHEVNTRSAIHVNQVLHEIPDNSLLVVIEGGSMIRGFGNTLRSLRSGPTLINVPLEKYELAAEAYPNYSKFLLTTHSAFSSAKISVATEVLQKFDFEQQWSSWLTDIYANPGASRSTSFVLIKPVEKQP